MKIFSRKATTLQVRVAFYLALFRRESCALWNYQETQADDFLYLFLLQNDAFRNNNKFISDVPNRQQASRSSGEV